MPAFDFPKLWHLLQTALYRRRAPAGEGTGGFFFLCGLDFDGSKSFCPLGGAFKKEFCVRVRRIFVKRCCGSLFNKNAAEHNADCIAKIRGDFQIVCDKQKTQTARRFNRQQQVENLRLMETSSAEMRCRCPPENSAGRRKSASGSKPTSCIIFSAAAYISFFDCRCEE